MQISVELMFCIMVCECIIEALALFWLTPIISKRAFMKALDSEEGDEIMARVIQKAIPKIMAMKVKTKKGQTGEEVEMPLFNYVIAVMVQNIKMHLLSLKKDVGNHISEQLAEVGGPIVVEQLIDGMVPKKYQGAARTFAAGLIQKVGLNKGTADSGTINLTG